MFEAVLQEAVLLKKILDGIKELVSDANFDINESGVSVQAMDSSHVSLVSLMLKADSFALYRADRTTSLGINLASLSKILRCAGNTDRLTLKSEESSDSIRLMFESEDEQRVSEFTLKLLDIAQETLGIPDQKYKATVELPSGELTRICRDLALLGDTVLISVSKEGVKFSVSGDSGTGSITLRQGEGAIDGGRRGGGGGGGDDDDDDDELDGDAADDDDDDDGERREKKRKKKASGGAARGGGGDGGVQITLYEPVVLTFALRYLNYFCKAASLSPTVTLSMSPDVPLVVEYMMEDVGYLRYYLAPKLNDGDDE